MNLGNSQESPQLMNGIYHLYAMEFYSAIKKNDILSFAGKWMELHLT
jgi:hypothetical protein